MKAARYALSKDPKGQAKGGTVGARYAAAQLGVPESQSVREWMKRLPEMEEALERAQATGGESASRHALRKKSMSTGRVRSRGEREHSQRLKNVLCVVDRSPRSRVWSWPRNRRMQQVDGVFLSVVFG